MNNDGVKTKDYKKIKSALFKIPLIKFKIE